MCSFIGSILYTVPDLISQQEAIGGFKVDFHRLSALALLSIEQEETENINFDDVIDQFAAAKSRKIPVTLFTTCLLKNKNKNRKMKAKKAPRTLATPLLPGECTGLYFYSKLRQSRFRRPMSINGPLVSAGTSIFSLLERERRIRA